MNVVNRDDVAIRLFITVGFILKSLTRQSKINNYQIWIPRLRGE